MGNTSEICFFDTLCLNYRKFFFFCFLRNVFLVSVLYVLEILSERYKDTKEIKEKMESLTDKVENMEKTNEQKYTQLEECMTQLQINFTNSEVSMPGE